MRKSPELFLEPPTPLVHLLTLTPLRSSFPLSPLSYMWPLACSTFTCSDRRAEECRTPRNHKEKKQKKTREGEKGREWERQRKGEKKGQKKVEKARKQFNQRKGEGLKIRMKHTHSSILHSSPFLFSRVDKQSRSEMQWTLVLCLTTFSKTGVTPFLSVLLCATHLSHTYTHQPSGDSWKCFFFFQPKASEQFKFHGLFPVKWLFYSNPDLHYSTLLLLWLWCSFEWKTGMNRKRMQCSCIPKGGTFVIRDNKPGSL